jgi:hypothetical protein
MCRTAKTAHQASRTDMRATFAGWVPLGSEKITFKMATHARMNPTVNQMRG